MMMLKQQPSVKCYVDNKPLLEAIHPTEFVGYIHLRIYATVLHIKMQRKDISVVSKTPAEKLSVNSIANSLASTR